mgnify:CR=1 FL=1
MVEGISEDMVYLMTDYPAVPRYWVLGELKRDNAVGGYPDGWHCVVKMEDYTALDAERQRLAYEVDVLSSDCSEARKRAARAEAYVIANKCAQEESDAALAKLAELEARVKHTDVMQITLARVTGALVDAGTVDTEDAEHGIEQLTRERDAAIKERQRLEGQVKDYTRAWAVLREYDITHREGRGVGLETCMHILGCQVRVMKTERDEALAKLARVERNYKEADITCGERYYEIEGLKQRVVELEQQRLAERQTHAAEVLALTQGANDLAATLCLAYIDRLTRALLRKDTTWGDVALIREARAGCHLPALDLFAPLDQPDTKGDT